MYEEVKIDSELLSQEDSIHGEELATDLPMENHQPVTAVGLLSNLETAQQERSVLLLDEQNLLVKEEKEGYA